MTARTARTKRAAPAQPTRQRRANGEESMQRILDVAAEIAGERGYDATSIALVSERSGLPASSIYWHFASKDELIAAVIERSYARWLSSMTAQPGRQRRRGLDAQLADVLRSTAQALLDAPDFLRLGLMLALERRPEPLQARATFLRVREDTMHRTVTAYTALFGEQLSREQIRLLATLAMANVDGLFIAHEIEGDGFDLESAFEAVATGLLAVARSMITASKRP